MAMIRLRNLIIWIAMAPVALAMPNRKDGPAATWKRGRTPTSLDSSTMSPTQYTHTMTDSPSPLPSSGPQSRAAVDMRTPDRGEYTLTIVNSHTAALSTQHGHNDGVPTAIIYDEGSHTIGMGASAILAIPTGWAGRIAIGEAAYEIGDRASLIEGSFLIQDSLESSPDGDAKVALDVSYVDAFTVPIVCQSGGQVVLGCNLDLNEMCPDQYRLDPSTCINPHRDGKAQGVENIFQDCSPMAYTLPDDLLGTVNGFPGHEHSITCCVGTACPLHPLQSICPTEGGGTGWCPEA